MTENERIRLMKEMQDFQKVKKASEEAVPEFFKEAVAVLKELVEVTKEIPCFKAMQDEEEDFYEEDAIVLYAEPGKAASLVEEEWALDELMIQHRGSVFQSRFIMEELMAVYPKECVREYADGTAVVDAPLYICHPIIDEDDDAKMDLTAVDFCEAMAYLTTHTIKNKENGRIGFLLDEEEKEWTRENLSNG